MKKSPLLFTILLGFMLSATLSAQAPPVVNYQGKLTRSSGSPLDTVVTMVFSLYSDPLTSSYLWRETQPDVSVEGGNFNVLLGNLTAIPISALDGSVRYLGLKIGSDPETFPRRPFVSVGYAMTASNSDKWDNHHWGEVYPQSSSCDIWDGHNWGDIYPSASSADVWDGHHWGDVYPTTSNADIWDGHHWGSDTYPNASNSDVCDGIHGTSFLRNDVSGTINGSLALAGFNHINFYSGAVERIRYDGGQLSPYHGMLLLVHPTRRFIFGTMNDAGQYISTLLTVPSKGQASMKYGMNFMSEGVEAGEPVLSVAGRDVLMMNGDRLEWGASYLSTTFYGNIGIGVAEPQFALDVSGITHAESFASTSDARLKTDISPLESVLSKLDKIRVVRYSLSTEATGRSANIQGRQIGVLAQEIKSIFPELVTSWGTNEYLAVDYGRLSAVLLEAVKELKSKNETLEARLRKLEGMAGE